MARHGSLSSTQRVAELARANEQLQAENASLKAELQQQSRVFTGGWRRVIIICCIALATAVLVVGNLLFWTGDTLVNSDRYTKTVKPLLQDTAIQQAVASYTTTKLFANVNAQQVVQNALPPRADFLAESLAAQLQNGTRQALEHVLASDKFQAVWAQSSGKAHQQLIDSIKHSNGDGVLNLQEVYDRLSQNLAGTKLSFLANKSLPANVGSIEIVRATWVPTARKVINNIGWIKPVTLLLVAILSALAIWLSRNRRKLAIILSSFFAAGMFMTLISVRVLRNRVVAHTAPAYQTAVDHAAHIITRSLVEQTATVMLVSLAIAIIAWLTGPYKSARSVRSRTASLFSGQVHQSLFGAHEPAWTRWLGARKRLVQWLVVACIAVIMLFVQLSPKAVLVYVLITLLAVLAIETLAAPLLSSRNSKQGKTYPH